MKNEVYIIESHENAATYANASAVVNIIQVGISPQLKAIDSVILWNLNAG